MVSNTSNNASIKDIVDIHVEDPYKLAKKVKDFFTRGNFSYTHPNVDTSGTVIQVQKDFKNVYSFKKSVIQYHNTFMSTDAKKNNSLSFSLKKVAPNKYAFNCVLAYANR